MNTEKNGLTLHQKLGHLSPDIRKDYNIEIYKKFRKTSEDKTFIIKCKNAKLIRFRSYKIISFF